MTQDIAISIDRLRLFEPQTSWFVQRPFGVHGISHETRVLILSQILCKTAVGVPKADADDLAWAAVFHDTQRMDDWEDTDHGSRASVFVKKNLSPKRNTFTPQLRVRRVSHICEWHVPPDYKCPSFDDNLRVFKDADALDRWRIGDLDRDFLRLQASIDLLDVSRELWQKTRHLDHDENVFLKILDTAVNMNIAV